MWLMSRCQNASTERPPPGPGRYWALTAVSELWEMAPGWSEVQSTASDGGRGWQAQPGEGEGSGHWEGKQVAFLKEEEMSFNSTHRET